MKVRKRHPTMTPDADDSNGGRNPAEAAAAVDAFLNHATKPATRPPRERKLSPLEAAVHDAEKRSRTGEWDGAGGRGFIGLYALCHRLVYGILPVDLGERAVFNRAAKQAAMCLHNHFDDDPGEMVEFVKWAWSREKAREEWAKREGVQRNRMGVFLQFSASLVTDYRVDEKRRQARRRV